jgi:hypothetical protein
MAEPFPNRTAEDEKKARNRSGIIVGLLPFIPALPLAVIIHNPLALLAPLYGFCPLDFLRNNASPPQWQVLLWGCASACICLAFAVYSLCARRFGSVFALTMWASTAILLFRIYEFVKDIDG